MNLENYTTPKLCSQNPEADARAEFLIYLLEMKKYNATI